MALAPTLLTFLYCHLDQTQKFGYIKRKVLETIQRNLARRGTSISIQTIENRLDIEISQAHTLSVQLLNAIKEETEFDVWNDNLIENLKMNFLQSKSIAA
jgi:hypothetical protein